MSNKLIKSKKVKKFPGQAPEPDFDSVPIPILCHSIEMILNNIRSRGYEVVDFDNKDKSVQQVRMIGNKVFFLTAREDKDGEGKAAAGGAINRAGKIIDSVSGAVPDVHQTQKDAGSETQKNRK